jgi:signal transduction histidine kinase
MKPIAVGIRPTMLLLSVLPAILVGLVLSFAFLHGRFADLDREIDQRGLAVARQLATASEFALLSHDVATLRALALTFVREPDIVGVVILDINGDVVADAGDKPVNALIQAGTTISESGPRRPSVVVYRSPIVPVDLASNGDVVSDVGDKPVNALIRVGTTISKSGPRRPGGVVYRSPIVPAALLSGDTYAVGAKPPESPVMASSLGMAVVEFSLQRVNADRNRLLLTGIATTLGGVFGAGFLGFMLSRRVTHPLLGIAKAVDQIGRGEEAVRVPVNSYGELRELEEGLNAMATRLDSVQSRMRQEIEEATAQLKAKKEEAERADMAKSRFLAAASHDLRQPMHAFSLLTASLSTGHRPPSPEIIRTINSAAQSVCALLDALLDMSRLDAGEMEAHIADIPAQELLDHVRDSFAAVARDRGITLRIVPSAYWLRSDPLLLQRIVFNLVSNALRYTKDGSIFVACRRSHGEIRIEVRDSGIGIPTQAHQIIFDEFVQLANPERDHGKGIGLGLAIVHRLCELLQHPIGLRSAPGKGSVFWVDVPAGVAKSEDQVRHVLDAWAGELFEGRTVLIIDDDKSSCEGMESLMASWGCKTVCAPDAENAITRCTDFGLKPDAILSDYRLAEHVTGIQAIAAVRRHFFSEIPAALVTGDTAVQITAMAHAAKLILLTKPTPPAQLRAVLTRLLPPPTE